MYNNDIRLSSSSSSPPSDQNDFIKQVVFTSIYYRKQMFSRSVFKFIYYYTVLFFIKETFFYSPWFQSEHKRTYINNSHSIIFIVPTTVQTFML